MKKSPSIRLLTAVSWSAIVVFAAASAAVAACLPEIGAAFDIDLSQQGAMLMARSILFAGAAFVTGAWADYASKSRILAAAVALLAMALVFVAGVRSYMLLIAGMMIMGMGMGSIEGVISPLTEDLHPHDVVRQMNVLHAFYPLGLVGMSIVAGFALRAGVPWRVLLLGLALPAAAIVVAALLSVPPPRASTSPEIVRVSALLRRPEVWRLCVAMGTTAGVEGALSYWSPTFLRTSYAGVSALGGAMGVTVLGLAMALGRFTTFHTARRMSVERLLLTLCAVSGLLTVGLVLIRGPWASFILIGGLGFSIASFWPGILTIASHRVAAGSAALMGILAVAGCIGFGVTPWLVGLAADAVGLRHGLWLLPAWIALAAAAMPREP